LQLIVTFSLELRSEKKQRERRLETWRRRGIDIDEKNEGELPLILLIRLRWLIQERAAKSRRMGRG